MHPFAALPILIIVYAIQRLSSRAGGERAAANEAQREEKRSLHLQIALLAAVSFACTSFTSFGARPLCIFG